MTTSMSAQLLGSVVRASPRGNHGHEEPNIPWEPIHGPSNKDTLVSMLLKKYWQGVARELKQILISLNELQELGSSEVERREEKNDKVVGFDAFIDQISEASIEKLTHGVVNRASPNATWNPDDPQEPLHPFKKIPPPEGTHNAEIKAAVAERLEPCEPAVSSTRDVLYLRAKLLLQAAGFLDVDKLVQYRPPPEWPPIWRKGQVPQLKLKSWPPQSAPEFESARCKVCSDILRGVLFQCTQEDCIEEPGLGKDDYVCEECFRLGKHNGSHLVKVYKHCILDETVHPLRSRELCHCSDVAPFDSNGNPAALYPIDPNLAHRVSQSSNDPKCQLFRIPQFVREAKEREMETPMELQTASAARKASTKAKKPISSLGMGEWMGANLMLSRVATKFPYGNTHIALMVGPIIIENGVPHTERGVLITNRDAFNYFAPVCKDDDLPWSIAIREDKTIVTQYRSPRPERRLKACMKQVVGGAFSGNSEKELEDEIVSILVSELATMNKITAREDEAKIEAAASQVLEKMKKLLEKRITYYFDKIAGRLFSPDVTLRWDAETNNCQYFCDSIFRYDDFGHLFAAHSDEDPKPDYLLSFVVRMQGYDAALVRTKYDVPNGLTEEYLLGFKTGRHDDADIFDTLQEYWYDWGGFKSHLYDHQDVFPWDCTEAFKKDDAAPPACGTCNIAKHVWAFPFDAWSIILLHLTKDRRWYCPTAKSKYIRLTDKEWMENRVKLFLALAALNRGAAAMSNTPQLVQSSKWLSSSPDAQFDRLKLGGIHRAQPFSHHFEIGRHTYFKLAPWIHLPLEARKRGYETMRAARRALPDVPPPRSDGPFPESLVGGSTMKSALKLLWNPVAGLPMELTQAALWF